MWDKSSFCIPKSADDVIVVVYLFVSVDSFIVIYGVWLFSCWGVDVAPVGDIASKESSE